jgi:hypothetical protein
VGAIYEVLTTMGKDGHLSRDRGSRSLVPPI